MFRLVQGISAGLGTTIIYSIVFQEKDEDTKNRNISITLLSYRIGSSIGPLITSFLIIPEEVKHNILLKTKTTDISKLFEINVIWPFIVSSILFFIPLLLCIFTDIEPSNDNNIDKKTDHIDRGIFKKDIQQLNNESTSAGNDNIILSLGNIEESDIIVDDKYKIESINEKDDNQINTFFCFNDLVIYILLNKKNIFLNIYLLYSLYLL